MKIDLNKILEYFNNLSDQLRYRLLGGVVFLVILLDLLLFVAPQIGGIASVNDQIKKISEDTQQVLVDRQRIKLLKKGLQKARDQLSALSIRVRPVQEVPAVLSNISSIAREYGMKIDQMIPEYNQLETLNTARDGKYYALPVLVKARGGYHNFGHFLNKMENGDLFFIMKDFIIQNDEKSINTHLFSLTIKIILVDRAPARSKNL